MSLPEALTLAIIPQNPNKRNPTSLTASTDFFTVRERLFERWLEYYPQDVSRANQLELPLAFGKPEDLPFLAPHFVDYMDRKRSQWDSGYVSTSLNLLTQQKLEQGIKQYIGEKQAIGIKNAGAVLLNYQTMSIEAMVGSADFFNKSLHGQVNAATAKRSPGSTLKAALHQTWHAKLQAALALHLQSISRIKKSLKIFQKT